MLCRVPLVKILKFLTNFLKDGKPGTCPFNAGYNGYRVKREEAPVNSRYYTGGIYNNNDPYYNGGSGYNNGLGGLGAIGGGFGGQSVGGFNGYNNGYQRDECYSDNECAGRQKCCQNFGYRQCVNPLYNG